jgi:hypothetical protein
VLPIISGIYFFISIRWTRQEPAMSKVGRRRGDTMSERHVSTAAEGIDEQETESLILKKGEM